MSPAYAPPLALEVKVGGVVLKLRDRSLEIDDTLGSRTTARFGVVERPTPYTFRKGQQVEIRVDDVLVFGGVIDLPKRGRPNPLVGYGHVIDCVDWYYLVDKRIVVGTYPTEEGQTVGDVVRDLITRYWADEGITEGTIEDGPAIQTIVLPYLRGITALDQLAESIAFMHTVNVDKSLDFHAPGATVAPWTLDATVVLAGSLLLSERNPLYRNQEILRGGIAYTSSQVESFAGDGTSQSFQTVYPIGKVPTVKTLRKSYRDLVLESSPTGYWRLNEASGTLADSSGNGYTMSATGTYGQPSAIASGDAADKSMSFTGGQYASFINAAFYFAAKSSLTLECFCKPTTVPPAAKRSLIESRGSTSPAQGLQIDLDTDGKLHANRIKGGAVIQTVPGLDVIPTNAWTHVATTYDGQTGRLALYVNGVYQGESTGGADWTVDNVHAFAVGAGWPSNFWYGQVDEPVFYWNRVVTEAEFYAHYRTALLGVGALAERTVGIRGVDTGKEWYWNKGDTAVSQETGTPALLAQDKIEVTYFGQFDTVVQSQDSAAIQARLDIEGFGSGIVEDVQDVAQDTDSDAMLTIAAGLLGVYAADGYTLEFSTRKPGLRSGQMLTVDLPSEGLSGDYLIESVRAQDEGAGRLRFDVSAIVGPSSGSWETFFSRIAGAVAGQKVSINERTVLTLLGSTSESWGWAESVVENAWACPFPAATQYPGTGVYPC